MVLKGYQALAYYDSESLIVSKHNVIYKYSIKTNTFTEIIRLSSSFKTYFSKISTAFRRLLRTDIRYGFKIDDTNFLVAYNSKLIQINFDTKRITAVTPIPRGSRPLNITKINEVNNFDSGVYFGEYFDNPQKDSVNIYRYDKNEVQIVFTFEKGKINHIHNLVPDSYNQCVWILAGDFGDSASIYRATDNFKCIEKVLSGSQDYRACIAFPTMFGLVYATDSQFQQNSIRLLYNDEKGWGIKELHKINGSCIYGSTSGKGYYFSTAVEAINSGNKFQRYLRNKRGPGIIKNQVEIISMDKNFNFKKIYENKKDKLPFVLFQFGAAIFASGINHSDYIAFTSIGTVKNDFSTLILNTK